MPSSNTGGKAVTFEKEKKRVISTKSNQKKKTQLGRKEKPDFLQKRPPEADIKEVKT
jgi:hypothetical protein